MAIQIPSILYAVPPREGHMRPALQISAFLISRGFEVTIIGTPNWKTAIENIGAKFSPIIGLWNTLSDPSRWPQIASAPTTEACLAASLYGGFVRLLPSGLETIRIALTEMRRQKPKGKIIVLSDTCFSGTLALKLGADLPSGFDGESGIKTIGIGVVPLFLADWNRPPWGSGLPYDDTPQGKARNLAAYAKSYDHDGEEMGRTVLSMLSCTQTLDELYEKYPTHIGMKRPFWDASTLCHDRTLQMSLPSLEFPATVWPKHIKFAGALPRKPLPEGLVYPAWFNELQRNRANDEQSKRVVFVAQGTEVLDYNELLVPTIKALSGREDTVVVALLCVRGAHLDLSYFEGGILPNNVRVIDYFPYDAILAYSDVFVSNSGYGGLTHAVSNGVPVVQAGKDFDKPDIGRRIEWSGLGVFLARPSPSPEHIRVAVDQILGNKRYRLRALELKKEASRNDPLGRVEKEILDLACDFN